MRQVGQPRRVTAALLRAIDRHQRSRLGSAGACRFEPSCSHYAEETLRSRSLLVAVLLIIGRLLRCNPLADARSVDPPRRARRWRPRPNALPTLFSILALSGGIVVVTAGIAAAVGVTNGCTATINGHDPAQLDSDHPLVVHKGENVTVSGTAPASVQDPKEASNTHIDVAIVEGVASVSSSDHPGHGRSWGGTVNVDNYLKYGVGLYHVTGVATGASGWTCNGDGYVQLKDGSPLTKPIGAGAAALVVIGAAGALASTRGSAEEAAADAGSVLPTYEADEDEALAVGAEVMVGDARTGWLATSGCLVLVLIAVGLAVLGKDIAAGAVGAAAPGGSPKAARVWAHGHPIVGFLSGLLVGIGVTVLMQQFAVWPLTIVTAIVFPLVVALLCAVRGYLGKPFKRAPGSPPAAAA